ADAGAFSQCARQARACAYVEWLRTCGRTHIRRRARELSARGWLDRDSESTATVYGWKLRNRENRERIAMFRTARIAPLHEQEGRGRRGRAILAALVLCAAFCGGCADMQQIPHASDDSPPANVFHFRDGGEAIFFAFVNGIDYAGRDPDTYVFAFSGSGCASMKYWLPRYFRGLEVDTGPIRIFVLHKRFSA